MIETFGKRLKALRESRFISVLELSQTIGVSQSIISYWENGKKDPSLSNVIKLADFFNISIDYLSGRDV